ncbi:MAG: arsenical pump-driving ATPase [Acidimicrobiales bacterium]
MTATGYDVDVRSDIMLERLLEAPAPYLFFTGKGGVGKTSLSAAVAVALADRGSRVLLVSTDPASNLSEVLGTDLGPEARPVTGLERLWALDIDPQAAAASYRERVVGPYRDALPDSVVAGIEEQLSGACTVEIAAFDEFSGLLSATSGYDHIVFDTAPTGHTLRLLSLPGAWTGYIDTNTVGVTCIGPLSGLTGQRSRYGDAYEALSDPARTTVVLVTRLDTAAVTEAERASAELADIGLANQHLVINGVFEPANEDPVALSLAARQRSVFDALPERIAALPVDMVPLVANPPTSIASLRALLLRSSPFGEGSLLQGNNTRVATRFPAHTHKLAHIVDTIAARGHGLVMTVGKGGVGKTTLAAAIACALSERGLPVVLSTTDPAAHLTGVLASEELPAGLVVERIDPEAVTAAYTAEVLSTAGAGLDAAGRGVLEEDLRSPCTEEIAVFQAFAATVANAQDRIVVLDTAPSGHTLLLLDAARSFKREIARQSSEVPADVESLLDHLADPDFTTILVVTLPEQTPVHEAAALQEDLRRAGIEPSAWVVNQSMAATGASSTASSTDPLLSALASHEQRWIDAAASTCSGLLTIAGWAPEPPIGLERLSALASEG